jgi:hypothetical protein
MRKAASLRTRFLHIFLGKISLSAGILVLDHMSAALLYAAGESRDSDVKVFCFFSSEKKAFINF